jgi:hypothetical protein
MISASALASGITPIVLQIVPQPLLLEVAVIVTTAVPSGKLPISVIERASTVSTPLTTELIATVVSLALLVESVTVIVVPSELRVSVSPGALMSGSPGV